MPSKKRVIPATLHLGVNMFSTRNPSPGTFMRHVGCIKSRFEILPAAINLCGLGWPEFVVSRTVLLLIFRATIPSEKNTINTGGRTRKRLEISSPLAQTGLVVALDEGAHIQMHSLHSPEPSTTPRGQGFAQFKSANSSNHILWETDCGPVTTSLQGLPLPPHHWALAAAHPRGGKQPPAGDGLAPTRQDWLRWDPTQKGDCLRLFTLSSSNQSLFQGERCQSFLSSIMSFH